MNEKTNLGFGIIKTINHREDSFSSFYSFFDSNEGKELFEAESYRKINDLILMVESMEKPKEFFFFNLKLKIKTKNYKGNFMEIGEMLWIKNNNTSVFLNFFSMKESKKYRLAEMPVLTRNNSLLLVTKGVIFRRKFFLSQGNFNLHYCGYYLNLRPWKTYRKSLLF